MTDETPQKPAADWYPDPSGTGQLRYWDGEQWTQDLRAQEQVAAAPAQGIAQPSGTEVLGATGGYGAGFAGVQGGTQVGPQQFGRQQHAHSGEAGFFRSLFDLSFAAERSVTIKFAKVLYVIGIALSVLGWLGGTLMLFILGGISSAAVSVYGGGGGGGMMMGGVLSLLLGWIPGFINIVILRVILELVTAVIRTSQHTAELVHLGRSSADKE